MLRVKNLSLKEEGNAEGEAPQCKKSWMMLQVKQLSLKRRG